MRASRYSLMRDLTRPPDGMMTCTLGLDDKSWALRASRYSLMRDLTRLPDGMMTCVLGLDDMRSTILVNATLVRSCAETCSRELEPVCDCESTMTTTTPSAHLVSLYTCIHTLHHIFDFECTNDVQHIRALALASLTDLQQPLSPRQHLHLWCSSRHLPNQSQTCRPQPELA